MGIYIDTNGSWGDADELTIIDDTAWNKKDYDELSEWSDSMLTEFAETPHGLTPIQWIKKYDER